MGDTVTDQVQAIRDTLARLQQAYADSLTTEIELVEIVAQQAGVTHMTILETLKNMREFRSLITGEGGNDGKK